MTNPEAIDDLPAIIRANLRNCLTDATFPELPNHYKGKVRDTYDLGNGKRILIATDRQSAFDKILTPVPFKGQILTALSHYWFTQTQKICKNHFIARLDPNVMVVKNVKIIPIEIVVRSYLTGSTDTSIWMNYQKGQRQFGGMTLPEGMKKNQALPDIILTPTTKEMNGGHDRPIEEKEILDKKIVNSDLWNQIKQKSFALFRHGQTLCSDQGLILVDTKYEFGLDENGELTLADEIHTPDSSRFWLKFAYSAALAKGVDPLSLDKEFLRLWVRSRCDPYKDQIPEIPDETIETFALKYIEAYEIITGQPFIPHISDTPIRERILKNIKGYLGKNT